MFLKNDNVIEDNIIIYQRIFETAPHRGAIFQLAIGISVEGYIRWADLILQRCKIYDVYIYT